MESNYEKQAYHARERFLTYDADEMIQKFHLEHDSEFLHLDLLDLHCRISQKDGRILLQSQNGSLQETECLDYQIVMTIYDVLCRPGELPSLTQKWCPLHALQVTMSSPNDSTFTKSYAQQFSQKTQKLARICQQIGGVQPPLRAGADVWWQFDFFPFFPIQFRFWDGDDEFEPKIQLLWDQNTLAFMKFETVYYAMGCLMKRLAERMEEEKRL